MSVVHCCGKEKEFLPCSIRELYFAAKMGDLRVAHILEANDIIRDIRRLSPSILYPSCAHVVAAVVATFSDASFNISSRKSYG